MNEGATAEAGGIGEPEPAPLKFWVVLPLLDETLLPC
jgi:hypothetical protein